MSLFRKEENALIRFFNSELVRIEPYGKNGLRVRATPDGRLSKNNRALLDIPAGTAKILISDEYAEITNGNATARIDKDGKITIVNQNNKVILEEALRLTPLKIPARHFKPNLLGKYQLTMSFESDPNEKIFGMGQYQQKFLNIKGCTMELAHRNSQASVPFYISSLGYGFLWNLPAIGEVAFGRNITKFRAESTDELDYLIIVNDTPSQILEEYMEAVGKAPMMPEYAMGFWQSKLRYRTQDELMSVARRYRELKIPLSVIVCDFFHWPHQGDFRFDYDYWQDPEGMTRELKEMGTELMVSVWPTIEKDSESYQEMLRGSYAAEFFTAAFLAAAKTGNGDEDLFRSAVKTRNWYVDDACEDLKQAAFKVMDAVKAETIIAESCKRTLKRDPVEMTPEYLAVIDEVEQKVEENMTTYGRGSCHERWSLTREYLEEKGIQWRSLGVMNPGFRFD